MASFEEQLAELERVVDRLESGGLPLEESVQLFESGMRLSNACKAQLSSAESRIQVLLEPESGGAVRVGELSVDVDDEDDDFEAEEDDEE
ncbi:MAG TPA: exodeoxyribonuclease VII small subunit [Acidobacteriaceae bacterium]